MIRSMTGYGKAETTAGKRRITVEIRSLNSKQLDLSVKVPAIYRAFDYDIRRKVSAVLVRGKVDVYIGYETESGAGGMVIDSDLFSNYYSQLRDIAVRNSVEWGGDALNGGILPAVLRLPDVIANESADADENEAAALMKAVDDALGAIDDFRAAEGKTLIGDILGRIGKIEEYSAEVVPYEKERSENIKKRIRENIASAGIPVDENRLEQEMIYYVEKLDITEEKVRLANHCKYFREVVADEENAGRKLGFISQEIGREINTLGSKANEANIQRIVIAMKDELEKIKEQLLNIL